MGKVNTNVLIVSMICCTTLIIFFYYQYNTPYNQCVRAYTNSNKPKYFDNNNDALADILSTGRENNYFKFIYGFTYKPMPMDKTVNIRDFGVEPVKTSREERLDEIAESANSICSRRLSN